MASQAKVVLVYPLPEAVGERMLAEQTSIVRPAGDDAASIEAVLGDADAIILRSPARITAAMIDKAPVLKVIGAYGAGTDNIDVAAATQRGIVVVSGVGIGHQSVAEYTIASAVAAHRQFFISHQRMTSGPVDWVRRVHEQRGTELTGTTWGVIGLGAIGRAVAKKAHGAFECRILAYSPHAPRDPKPDYLRFVDELDELLEASLTVSVHTPLSAATRGLLRRPQLRRIGPNGVLIHVARGGIVDETDLVAALNAGELKGAVLDVFENEPPTAEQVARLASARNILLTPHNSGITDQAQVALATNVAQGILDVLSGKRPARVANPEVFTQGARAGSAST